MDNYFSLARHGPYRQCGQVTARNGSQVRPLQSFCPSIADPSPRLVAQNGSIVDRDEEQAEIYVRGPLVMQGYLGNPEATRAIIDTEGWLKTGDVGYRDGGKYYIVDRVKVGQSLRFGLDPINASAISDQPLTVPQ